MEYRILGPFEVADGDRVVQIRAAKQRAVLLCLLIRANEAVSGDQLVDALWGEDAPRSAPKLVQVYVSKLRRVLGDAAIETHSAGYLLPLDRDSLDAAHFERVLGEGRAALARGNAQIALSRLDRALGLWRGQALQDVAYERFASAEANRLEELRLVCLEERIAAELELGRHDAVLAELRLLVSEYPLRERLTQQLMLALYRSGRQVDALDAYRATAAALREELGLDPGPELRALERAILNQEPALDRRGDAVSEHRPVPVPLSSFVGRADELAKLLATLGRDDVRLLTITGAGGTGKTRLALEVARHADSGFANGAAFVELAPVRDPALVTQTVALALDAVELADEPALGLGRWLRDQELLLVVDNFEHVVDSASELTRILTQAPHVTLLVTSRRVLHVSGEHVFPLQPLPEDDAERLFAERAVARDPEVDLSDRQAIRAICRRLDGLPLAIELAAARASALAPPLLLEKLVGGVSSLGIGPRDAPARQKTIADTLAWSTDLLAEEEQAALARLSVFAGGASQDAIGAVARATPDQVEALLDSSLLQRMDGAAGRVTLLETVREHAASLLARLGERGRIDAAHGQYYLQLAETVPLRGTDREEGFRLVDLDLDNFRVACDRAEARADHETALRIATALYPYWWVRGHVREGSERVSRPLEQGAGSPALRAQAFHVLAGLHWLTGDGTAAQASAETGIELGTAAGALEAVLGCHTVLGIVARDSGELATARRHYEQSGKIAEELGLIEDVTIANTNLADLALAAGDLEEARRRWETTIAQNREQGMPPGEDCLAQLGLGTVALLEGRLDEAEIGLARAYELSELAGFPQAGALALAGLAAVAGERVEHEESALLLGAAHGLIDSTGCELSGPEAELFDRTRAKGVAALGEEKLAELVGLGRAEGPEGPAVSRALARSGPRA